jgi:hypothetical protein
VELSAEDLTAVLDALCSLSEGIRSSAAGEQPEGLLSGPK